MKIIIADGRQEADYIINQFNTKKDEIYVLNSDAKVCKYLSRNNKVNVIYGKINKEYDLRSASCLNADLFIALNDDDIMNYVACQMAKMMFHVKKTIAAVRNPKNVEVFKKLGVDSPMSTTYLLAETIKSELSIENMIKTLAFEDNKIIVSEFSIDEKNKLVGKALKNIKFPKNTSVCCIYRTTGMIIPNGETIIERDDKVLMVSSYNDKEKIEKFVIRGI